ncbi:MAG: nucleotidyltransferase domain-containing protein [Methylococcales bacterium]
MQIRCKDFLENAEGLIFAVLVDGIEDDRFLCFLRYLRTGPSFRKIETEEANRLVTMDFPQYRLHSRQRDVDLHGVARDQIVGHYRPMQRLHEIISTASRDPIENNLVSVVKVLENSGLSPARLGVTGSLLIGAQKAGSDIDLVVYDRDDFEQLREIVRQAIANKSLAALNETQWAETYRRRGCSLSFDEYLWHEGRKYNKASWSGTKIDFSLVSELADQDHRSYRKIKPAEITARVIDARYAFDHPARYPVNHSDIHEIISFTPTFAGQAIAGETVIACGILEESECGMRRLVVGSSREAPGETIKVVRSAV